MSLFTCCKGKKKKSVILSDIFSRSSSGVSNAFEGDSTDCSWEIRDYRSFYIRDYRIT
jgi:hypothetical protein